MRRRLSQSSFIYDRFIKVKISRTTVGVQVVRSVSSAIGYYKISLYDVISPQKDRKAL